MMFARAWISLCSQDGSRPTQVATFAEANAVLKDWAGNDSFREQGHENVQFVVAFAGGGSFSGMIRVHRHHAGPLSNRMLEDNIRDRAQRGGWASLLELFQLDDGHAQTRPRTIGGGEPYPYAHERRAVP